MRALKITSVLGMIALIVLIFNMLQIFESDGFYPEKGSVAYYIGISNLIRNAPAINNITEPIYYGSVGDGSKLPQSRVVYEANLIDLQEIENKTEIFLNSNGFGSDAPKKSLSDLFDPEEKMLLRQRDYTSSSGELASLLIYKLTKNKDLQIEIIHYE